MLECRLPFCEVISPERKLGFSAVVARIASRLERVCLVLGDDELLRNLLVTLEAHQGGSPVEKVRSDCRCKSTG